VKPNPREGRRPVSFDGVAEAFVYAVLIFAPLAFGVREAWSREIFLLLVSASALVVAVKHAARAWAGVASGYRWSWAYPVMLAFLALCAVQAVPSPAAWVRAVSPGTLDLKSELLADLPAADGLLRRVTVTFYPNATILQAVLVAALVALFVVVLDVFRDAARIRRLLSVIAGMGLVMAAVAGVQNLTGWRVPLALAAGWQPRSGLFSNHNLFSQFMNLSVGAALGLLLDRVAELSAYCRTPGETWSVLRQPRHAVVWVWATLCVAGPLVVILSMSRMGMVSLAVATVVTAGMFVWRGRASGAGTDRAWVFVGLGAAVFAIVLYAAFDVMTSRMSTLRDLDTAGGGRQEMLRDMTAEFRRFPLLGTGLGTHQFVFGLFDHRNVATIATHAENEYAQLLEETGVVGATLAGAFLLGAVVAYARAVRRPTDPIDQVAFGLGFGLIAVLIHSGSDFGQHFPAVAAVTTTFFALLASLSRRSEPTSDAPPSPAGQRVLRGIAHSVVALVAVGAVVCVGLWSDRARRAESAWSEVTRRAAALEAKDWAGSEAEFASLLAPAATAVSLEPGDVEYQYWINLYRFFAVPSYPDPKTGVDTVAPQNMPAVRQIVADMDAARLLCPTYGVPLSITGQINRDKLNRSDLGGRQIRLSYRLAPYNTSITLLAGTDALARNLPADAAAALRHYAALGGSVHDYADDCILAGHPEIAHDIVKTDRASLLYLAGRLTAGGPKFASLADQCRREAAALLATEAAGPNVPAATLVDLGEAAAREGRTGDAIDLYRRALLLDYGNVPWRTRLARLLADAGRPAEAAREARVVLQLRPGSADAQAMAHEYLARAATLPTTGP
jgi:tetratricopeptide (TPR) repeat protein